ncbi:MAG: glycosyltransferase family 4 protein [Gemmatimonadaceae bacterium]
MRRDSTQEWSGVAVQGDILTSGELPADIGLRVLMVIPGPEHDQAVFSFARRQIDSIAEAGVTVERFYLASRTSVAVLQRERQRLRERIAAFMPHIVHAHFGSMTAYAVTLTSRIPVVVTFRGTDLNPRYHSAWRNLTDGFVRTNLGHALSHAASWKAAGIVCVSAQLRDKLVGQARRARAIVVPVGVRLDRFPLIPRERARAILEWAPDAPVILFNAGRNPKSKRVDLALASWRVVQRTMPQARLVLLDGHQAPESVPLYLNAADCVLMTSDYEGSPNIVKEAMACNLPVVTTPVGDTRERLARVRPSAIVAPDPEALGAAVLQMLKDPCRSNGREIVAEELRDEVLTRKIVALYERIRQQTADVR